MVKGEIIDLTSFSVFLIQFHSYIFSFVSKNRKIEILWLNVINFNFNYILWRNYWNYMILTASVLTYYIIQWELVTCIWYFAWKYLLQTFFLRFFMPALKSWNTKCRDVEFCHKTAFVQYALSSICWMSNKILSFAWGKQTNVTVLHSGGNRISNIIRFWWAELISLCWNFNLFLF